MTRYVYRDTQTGRFARKETWKRSKAQGGKRYKKERVRKKHKRFPAPPPPPPPLPPPERVYEWIVSFVYTESGRSFDVIVTARSKAEAYQVAERFLLDDIQGRKVVRAGYAGWQRRSARGVETDEVPGLAEYRDESEA